MPAAIPIGRRVNQWLTRLGFPADWFLIPLAVVIGLLGGLAATGFDWLVHNTVGLFYHHFHEMHLTPTHVAVLVGVPALGGLVVGVIRYFFGREMGGHGVPAVMEALARQGGYIRGRVGVLRAATATVTIGTGGSAGVEGPIIQIGSVIGSVVGQVSRVSRQHLQVLVGAGAAAGLSGIFMAPIAAVLFVVEVLLRDFSLKAFVPLIIASVLGTATAKAVLGGGGALFNVPPELIAQQSFPLAELAFYGLLGLICGVVGWAFTGLLHGVEALADRVPGHPIIKPVLGALGLGMLGVIFIGLFPAPLAAYKPPLFYANGYPVVQALFHPASYDGGAAADGALVMQVGLGLIVVTLLFKMLGTSLSLGSGGSGGVFAPSLFMGATLGAAFGMLLDATGWAGEMTPATYALTGMAGVLSASVHCPLTAFLLVFELTGDEKAIIPAMLVAILAVVVAQALHRDSIYTIDLRRRGIHMGSLSDMTLLRRLSVGDVPLAPSVTVHLGEPAQRLIDLAEDYATVDYVVCGPDGSYRGMVVGADVRSVLIEREAIPLMIVDELMRSDLPTVGRDETLDIVLDKFSRYDVSSLAVVDADETVQGVITRSRLMQIYQRTLEERG
jgi:CIC family chloride channel protein